MNNVYFSVSSSQSELCAFPVTAIKHQGSANTMIALVLSVQAFALEVIKL